jgi:hypothetical protein
LAPVQGVVAFLHSSADMQRCRRAMGGAIAAFDPDVATSPRGVFCLVRTILSSPCQPLATLHA